MEAKEAFLDTNLNLILYNKGCLLKYQFKFLSIFDDEFGFPMFVLEKKIGYTIDMRIFMSVKDI